MEDKAIEIKHEDIAITNIQYSETRPDPYKVYRLAHWNNKTVIVCVYNWPTDKRTYEFVYNMFHLKLHDQTNNVKLLAYCFDPDKSGILIYEKSEENLNILLNGNRNKLKISNDFPWASAISARF